MSYIDSRSPSTTVSHDTTLSPAAREAKEIIPTNMVKERARLYGEQVNRVTAPKGHTKQLVAIAQDALKSDRKIPKNDAPLVSNRKKPLYKEESFTSLPEEMRVLIYALLGTSSLNTLSEISRGMHETVQSSIFVQNKILCDFALKMALQMRTEELKDVELQDIAIEQVKNGDIAEAKKTALLIEDYNLKSQALQNIAIKLAKSGSIAEAKKTALLIKESCFQSEALQNIAITLAKNEDMIGAKEVLSSLKAMTLLQPSSYTKLDTLSGIATVQAQCGDITGAKETLLLVGNTYFKFRVEENIAIEEARRGSTAGMKKHITDMKKMRQFSQAIPLTLKLARLVRSRSGE